MLPSATLMINNKFSFEIIEIPISYQVPALLLTGLLCGPKAGTIAAIAYLTIGLFYLPVFHGGGSIGYIATPGFGYLASFVPAAWITGQIVQLRRKNSIYKLFRASISGLTIIHMVGIINILIGTLTSRWNYSLIELLYIYSISNFPFQFLLCIPIILLAKSIRKILFLE